MLFTCDYCGKLFECYESQRKYKHHYCSNDCRYKAKRMQNIILYENDYAYFIINRNGIKYKCLFDIEDIDKINEYKWHIHIRNKRDRRPDVCSNTYVEHNKRKYINLARHLMGYPKDLQIDHINRNTLDNRRKNLRICTNFENQNNKSTNTSGHVGVVWDKSRNKWKVSLGFNNKTYNIGRFDSLEEAINARREQEKELGIYKDI